MSLIHLQPEYLGNHRWIILIDLPYSYIHTLIMTIHPNTQERAYIYIQRARQIIRYQIATHIALYLQK